jgi:hypothetical protein
MQVFFGVDADGVEVGGFDVDVNAVFEEAELFEAFYLFEGARRKGGEVLEGRFAVGVEADVLPVLGRCFIAVVGDGGAREVERAAVRGGDYFDCVGVGYVLLGAEDLEGGDLDVRLGEGAEERGEVLGFEEGFVALDVDVDVGWDLLGDGVDAVGAAGKLGGGELDGPIVLPAEGGYFIGVGGDDDAVELGAGRSGFEDPGEHGPAGDGAEDLAGEARGGEARRNNTEDDWLWLFGLRGIKYDWIWLCRDEYLSSNRCLVPVFPYTLRRCSSDG